MRGKLALYLEVIPALEQHDLPKLSRLLAVPEDEVEVVQGKQLKLLQSLNLPLVDIRHVLLAGKRPPPFFLCGKFHGNIREGLLELLLDGPRQHLNHDHLPYIRQSYLFVDPIQVAHVDAHFLHDAFDGVTVHEHQLKIVKSIDQQRNPIGLDESARLLHLGVLGALGLHGQGGAHEGLCEQLAVVALVVVAEEGHELRPQPGQVVLPFFLEVVVNWEHYSGVDEIVEIGKNQLVLRFIFLEIVLKDLELVSKRRQYLLLGIDIIRLTLDIEHILNHIQGILQFAHQLKIPLMRVQVVYLRLL